MAFVSTSKKRTDGGFLGAALKRVLNAKDLLLFDNSQRVRFNVVNGGPRMLTQSVVQVLYGDKLSVVRPQQEPVLSEKWKAESAR